LELSTGFMALPWTYPVCDPFIDGIFHYKPTFFPFIDGIFPSKPSSYWDPLEALASTRKTFTEPSRSAKALTPGGRSKQEYFGDIYIDVYVHIYNI
jgi:hypothetical protein